MAIDRRVTGRIAYWAPNNLRIGTEWFDLVAHPGGHHFRAFCALDDVGVLRDVSMAFDQAWHPLDAFSRVTRDGRVMASTQFHFTSDEVSHRGEIAGTDGIDQRFPNAPPFTYCGLHPLQGDALIATRANLAEPGAFTIVRSITNSLAVNGDEGFHAVPIDISVAFIARESITVAAGTFASFRFALRWRDEWPAADLWVRADDFVFLKLTWTMIEAWYELEDVSAD